MRKNRRNIFTSGILLMILAAYAFCITSFTHSHIINGVMIVHSHPFEKDTTHNHTKSQVLTIDQLSQANLLPAEPITSISPVLTPVYELTYDSRLSKAPGRTLTYTSLRAPPSFS
ncbi:MAG: hypothetical protein ACRCX4_07915 [Bacteroidales bacterium]